MRVTIIGPGNMGRGIATRVLAGGHAVTLVGRDRQQAGALATELEPRATSSAQISAASGPDDAVPGSEVVILAMPYATNLVIARQNARLLSGKVVVDICNPLNENYDGLVTEGGPSAAETIRDSVPDGARVVKAFNTTFAATLLEGEVAGQPLDVFVAGDDEDAVGLVLELVQSTGLRPIPVGPLARSRQLEQLGFFGILLQGRLNTNFMTAWKLILPGSAPPPAETKGFPREAVVGVIDNPDSVGRAVTALMGLGIEEARIHVLAGHEGRGQIESSQGTADLLAQLIGFEHEHSQRHLRELDAGHAVLLIEAKNEAIAESVGESLRQQGGHFINYYSRWTARSLVT